MSSCVTGHSQSRLAQCRQRWSLIWGRMTWHDQRLVLLIAGMLVALYSLFLNDERLILLTLGALVALYVPFVVFG